MARRAARLLVLLVPALCVVWVASAAVVEHTFNVHDPIPPDFADSHSLD
jgi:hypothetical protein